MKLKILMIKLKDLYTYKDRWILLFISALFIGMISESSIAEGEAATHYDTSVIGYMWGLAVAIVCCNEFFSRWLVPSSELENGILESRNLTDYARYHAFPTRELFGSILKKYLPVNMVIAIVYLVFGIANKTYGKISVAVIMLGIPFVIWKIRLFIFEYELTHSVSRISYELVKAFINFVIWLFEIGVVIFSNILIQMFLFSIGTSLFAPADEGKIESVSIMKMSDGFAWFMLAGFALSLILFGFTRKKLSIFAVCMCTFGVICFGTAALMETTDSYTKITGNEVMVVESGKKTEYTFDDVAKFTVKNVEKDDEYTKKCVMEFKNGKKIVFRDDYSFENNDAWTNEYKDFDGYIEWIDRTVNGK
ncbi:MAG: hypothetical protein K6G88_04570 [Lachnospiraceae bacterium]|nr:hypothetical protein [Lachnospiraceae bacterium]